MLGLNPAMVSGGGGQVATDYRTSKLHWIPDDNSVGRYKSPSRRTWCNAWNGGGKTDFLVPTVMKLQSDGSKIA